MKKSVFKTISLIGLCSTLVLSACSDDDDSSPAPQTPAAESFLTSQVGKLNAGNTIGSFTIPSNYDLTGSLGPGIYSGQVRRLAQLQEIKDSTRVANIKWNLRAALVNTNRDQFASTAAQGGSDIRTKIDELNFDAGNTAVADQFGELADSLMMSSQANFTTIASNGVAGYLNNRHFSANGLEYAQILEKGLYGAMMYDQMVDDYLRPTQAGAQNPNGNNSGQVSNYATHGTDRQHRWDEVFGYLGANPLTYPNTSNTSNGDGSFIANYTFDFSDEIEAAMGINPAKKLMEAFVFGRSVLKAGEAATANAETTNEAYYEAARADVKLYTEVGLAAAAYHYLNDAISDASDADKIHHLSEALAFIYALSFNSEGRLTATEAHNVLIALGWSSTDASLRGMYQINLWNVTDAQMQNAKSILDQSFPGFGALPL